MPLLRNSAIYSFVLVGLALILHGWRQIEVGHATCYLAYDQDGVSTPIIIPAKATDTERTAAKLIAETLALASGRKESNFPILPEYYHRLESRGIYVGATQEAKVFPALTGSSLIDRPVSWTVLPQAVLVTARNPEDVLTAASWFLEQTVGARWFIPGPLGREVEHPARLALPFGDHFTCPSFVSRDFYGLDQPIERDWYKRNRLLALLGHGHNMGDIFPEAVFKAHPEIAPIHDGARYLPPAKNNGSWQPDFTQASAVEVAATAALASFRRNPSQPTFTFCQNDTFLFDQSDATIATLRPEQYFRGKPDYANLVFGYLSKVASRVGKEFPDRFITTYSYYWTENAPRFPVASNILPFLTADRSNWFEPKFAEEDRALMRRWRDTGVSMFAMYDYFESKSYYIPNPTLYAVTGPIPSGYALGARGYFAEATPNWGSDGPKLWVTAQLLWDVRQDPAKLIDEYYVRYWQEAAGPMREYFELCERQWLNQPKPTAWLKYFKDDQQRLLFPPQAMAEMKSLLTKAKIAAKSEMVRQRLRLVILAYNRTVAFCRHDLERETLHRLAVNPAATSEQLEEAWNRYSTAREKLQELYLKPAAPNTLSTSPELLPEYLRDDPRGRVAWQLLQRGRGFSQLDQRSLAKLLPVGFAQAVTGLHLGEELLPDPSMRTLHKRTGVHPFILLDWAQPGSQWVVRGEPAEHRRIELHPTADGGQSLFYQGGYEESCYRWIRAEPGKAYLASAGVQARVSQGNSSFLLVSFLDKDGHHLGLGHSDRLPPGDWSAGTELQVLVQAPKEAYYIGFGVRAAGQAPGDFAEYSDLSLRLVQ